MKLFRCDYICNRISTSMGYVSHVTHIKHPITIKHIWEQPIGAQYNLATVLVLCTHIMSDSGKCSKKPVAFTKDSY